MRRWAGPAALAGLAALYLSTPERVYVFDGVMFAGVIERSVDDWREALFNRRHLIFNPLMMAARDLLAKIGFPVSGYGVMQGVNALAAAAGVGLFFLMVRRLTRDAAVAFAAAAALAVSAAYWSRAVEGQVYLLAALGALAGVYALLLYIEDPRPAKAAGAATAIVGAVLLHAVNAALFFVAGAAVLLSGARAARRGAGLLAAAAAGVLVPYAAAFRLSGPAAFLDFFLKGTEYYSPGVKTTFGGLLWRFLHNGGLPAAGRAALVLDEAGSALLFGVGRPWIFPVGAALLGISAAAASEGLMDRSTRRSAAVLLSAALAFVAVNSFWLGGVFFWPAPLAALLALCAMDAARRLKASRPERRRAAIGLFVSGVAALGLWNYAAGIRPQGRLEDNAGYRGAMFVAAHTAPSSWIVISGFGAFPNSKVYLPYFAHRTRQVLEYFFDRNPKPEALARFRAFLQDNIKSGVPIYLLSDLVEEAGINRQLMTKWGLSIDELRACFGPGSVLPLARSSGGLGVFLFEPQGRLPALFCGLGYDALTAEPGPRLEEEGATLKVLASNMTPGERRKAAETLKKSDDGAELLLAGFSHYIDAAAARAAQERLAAFHQYQNTGIFHLRLGGLYHLLGATADARREWGECYRLTKDPRALSAIEETR